MLYWVMPMTGHILLINTNIIKPSVSPVGLEHVGEDLEELKTAVQLGIDLMFDDQLG
jgi:hypothetical protein